MTREELKNAKPILFNTEMVRAILDGRKTATRRLVGEKAAVVRKDQEININLSGRFELYNITPRCGIPQNVFFKPPYKPGDILYVRETWKIVDYLDNLSLKFEYEADGKISGLIDFTSNRLQKFLKYMNKKGWCPALFMPKEVARIFLQVTDVQVEQLRDITEEQARKEGMPDSLDYPVDKIYCPVCNGSGFVGGYNSTSLGFEEKECQNCDTAVKRFKNLWNSTIKKSDLGRYDWDANPWVWVIEFERVMDDENTD